MVECGALLLGAAVALVAAWAILGGRRPLAKEKDVGRAAGERSRGDGGHEEAKRVRERTSDRRRVRLARRRERLARRRERRAQRVLAMARCLVGCGPAELGARGTRAVVDNFGADTSSLWLTTGGRPVRLGEARRPNAWAPEPSWPGPGVESSGVGDSPLSNGGMPASRSEKDGCVHYVPLRDEARRTVAILVIGFSLAMRRRPPGLEAYAAFLGQHLAVEIARASAELQGGAPAQPIAVVSLAGRGFSSISGPDIDLGRPGG